VIPAKRQFYSVARKKKIAGPWVPEVLTGSYLGIEYALTHTAPDGWRFHFWIGDTPKSGQTRNKLGLLAQRRVPATIAIIPPGPALSPLGDDSTACFNGPGQDCGYTG
jgi:hypothetical protein